MGYFAVPYDIHFDDTMAYGSHHFLTNFKFQCAGREHLLFGPHFFEVPELRRDFEQVLLLTYEGYTRNLAPAVLGDRLVVLTTIEEWGEVSLRFCFRTLKADGTPVACGYQTVLCAGRADGALCPFPASFRRCYEAMASIDEAPAAKSFKDRVLQGGSAAGELFPESIRRRVKELSADPASLGTARIVDAVENTVPPGEPRLPPGSTAFLFGGQGTFEPGLFIRLKALQPELRDELAGVAEVCRTLGFDVGALLSAQDAAAVGRAIEQAPRLDQLGIFLSGVLGARWLERHGQRPDVFVGHSFGEIAALTAAGALELRAGAEVVCQRILALQVVPEDAGTLAAVALGEAETARAIAESGVRGLEVAGRNHSRQTVVAGPRAALEQLRAQLERRGQGFTFISSRYPFHHPVLAPAAEAFRARLAGVVMRSPRAPVYSPIERRMYGQGETAAVFASHLVRPFDFAGAVETLVRAGCTRFVDCGTDGRLTRIVQRIRPGDSTVEATAISGVLPAPVPAAVPEEDPAIAVVSLGCILPGGAKDAEAYWQNIRQGISGIVDPGQLHPELVTDFMGPAGTPDRAYTLLTGQVRDSDLVPPPGLDPARFHGYAREQKLLAIALSQALRGLEGAAAKGRIQCLLGSTADGSAEYDAALCAEAGEALLRARGEHGPGLASLVRAAKAAFGAEATSTDLAPHRTLQAVVTDVAGPGVPAVLLDAACASSLYAIALGMKALELGEARLVLAGGVFSPGPGNSCLFSQFKGLSATGSRPFDERADGVIFGEGAAVVGLMRLKDAVASGVRVHAIIRGAGLSSDGRSSSANVPRSEGQVAAMEACYAASGVEPSTIQYIEAHGTATPAGDATELKSIAQVFGGKRGGIQLASVKALIGHTGWAAGAASVIKLCKALEHRLIPRQSNFDRPGSGLRALGPDFEVSTREQPWPENGEHPRRAATNGFGFGGTNAHLVLEEYRGVPPPARPGRTPATGQGLVVVAAEGLFPDGAGVPVAGVPARPGTRFDSRAIRLPPSVRLLPDIAEDMDPTQTLGLAVASALAGKLAGFDTLRSRTALVLGLEGKTHRGVEATQRVLASATRRRIRELVHRAPELSGVLPLADRLHEVVTEAIRPSGPYTLQGMMPNVTPGRIAGALDLKGPNFVVDAGGASLASALHASRALLESGFELVLVGSTHVRRPGEGAQPSQPDEGVMLLAVTTEASAARLGLKPLCHLRSAVEGEAGTELPPHSAAESLEVLRSVLAAAEGRATTLRFHPDAATGTRLALHVLPAEARLSGAPERVAAPSSTAVRPEQTSTVGAAPDRALPSASVPGTAHGFSPPASIHSPSSSVRLAPDRALSSASVPGTAHGFSLPASIHSSSSSVRLAPDRALPPASVSSMTGGAGHTAPIHVPSPMARSTPDSAPPPASIPAATGGFDHTAPIHYHAPVLVEQPARPTRPAHLRGRRVLFIAQDLALAHELAARAEALCGPEHLILYAGAAGAPGRLRGIDLTSEDTAEAGLAALGFEPQVILAVCRLEPGAAESEVVSGTALRHEALELLFLAARRSYERLTAGEAELASLCIGGVGPRRILHPITGLFAGMLKSIAREVPARNVRAIATSAHSIPEALALAVTELGSDDAGPPPVEVCFDGPVRCVRRLRPTGVLADSTPLLDGRSVVLLTGGGRGVTAVLAGALLKRYGCTVVLLGRSAPDAAPAHVLQARDEDLPRLEREFYAAELASGRGARMPELRARFERYLAARELRSTLDALAQLPGKVLYRAADVTRPEDVERVVEELVREHGRLDLVVHGAGTQTSKKLNRRRLAELRGNLDTKLLGLRNLHASCAKHLTRPVPFHVLTSAFSFIGNDGQADYGAANEALDRLCAWVSDSRQDVRWSSAGWLAWDGIGMTRGSEYRVLGASRQLRGIRAEEGEALFLQLVEGMPREPINVQLTESERAYYGLELLPPREESRSTRHELVIDAASVPCLEDHLVRGTPTLPGAWALDLMLQAALGHGRPELRTVTIEDARFSRFIRVKPGGRQPLRAECTRLADEPGRHCVQVKLLGDIVHASGAVLERDVVYAEARFTLTAEPPRATPQLEAARPSGRGVSVRDPHCIQGGPIELRKMFDCLEEIRLEETARFARLGLPQAPRQAGHTVPALVLDAALRLSAMHADGVSDAVFAPVQLQRITFDRGLVEGGRRLSLKALAPRRDGDVVQCGSVAAIDEAGRLRMLFEGGLARPLA